MAKLDMSTEISPPSIAINDNANPRKRSRLESEAAPETVGKVQKVDKIGFVSRYRSSSQTSAAPAPLMETKQEHASVKAHTEMIHSPANTYSLYDLEVVFGPESDTDADVDSDSDFDFGSDAEDSDDDEEESDEDDAGGNGEDDGTGQAVLRRISSPGLGHRRTRPHLMEQEPSYPERREQLTSIRWEAHLTRRPEEQDRVVMGIRCETEKCSQNTNGFLGT